METKGLTSKDYQDAMDVQDACNLSGVVNSFSRVMSKIWEQARINGTVGTESVNTHPIALLYADKIAHLTGTQGTDGCEPLSEAWGICEDEASRAVTV